MTTIILRDERIFDIVDRKISLLVSAMICTTFAITTLIFSNSCFPLYFYAALFVIMCVSQELLFIRINYKVNKIIN